MLKELFASMGNDVDLIIEPNLTKTGVLDEEASVFKGDWEYSGPLELRITHEHYRDPNSNPQTVVSIPIQRLISSYGDLSPMDYMYLFDCGAEYLAHKRGAAACLENIAAELRKQADNCEAVFNDENCEN
tara:strand:+ start:1019 stop:1408 length:390 start_codon:yes stop_codon:yes gene_type:complete